MSDFDTRPYTYKYHDGTFAAFDERDARFNSGFETLAHANDYAASRRFDCHVCGKLNGH